MKLSLAKQRLVSEKIVEDYVKFGKINIFSVLNKTEDDFKASSEVRSENFLPTQLINVYSELIELPEQNQENINEVESQKPSEVVKSDNKDLRRFFDRVSKHIDHIKNFLDTFKTNQLRSITQEKILFETDKIDQQQRTYKAKRIAKENAEYEKEDEEKEVNLQNDSNLATKLAGLLGLGLAATAISPAAAAPMDVPYQAEPGQLKQKGATQVGQISGYPVTSGFGWRWGKNHGGVDVGVPIGTMFAIKAQSKVVYAGWQNPKNPNEGYGLMVDVWVDQIGQMLRFAHLNSVAVKVGDNLPAGTILGRSGSTGRSTGPHFHIEAHDSITPGYGKKDPTPYLGYVILGDEVQQRAEGSVERVGKIMVGEAGKEFLIKKSQMPLFVQAMMEEKIRSLNPMYQVSGGFDGGIQSSFGTPGTTFASGGVAGSPEFWKIVALTSREDSLHPQGQADVAQSLYNRSAVGAYPGGKNISNIITAPGQYEPTFNSPGAWSSIKDRKSAIAAAGKGAGPVDMAFKAITNPLLQKEAARFIGGRTDFMGESQKPYMKPGDITRGKNYNFHGWFYNARLDKPAAVAPSVKSMTQSAPKTKPASSPPPPKNLNLIEKFMLWINPPKSERASLNRIDEVTQREIAYETQSQYDMNDMSNEIVYFYQPTYYYPEEVA